MPTSRGLYQILGANDTEELRWKLNMLLSEISDRLDKIEGIRGTAAIESNLELAGNANVASDLNLTGNAAVGGNQAVSGASSVTGNSTVGGDATVSGKTTLEDAALIAGHFRIVRVDDNTDVVTETVQWEGDAYAAGNMSIGANGIIGGDVFIGGFLDGPNVPVLPIGLVCAWSGTIADIPYKWVLCDGDNGSPDLRGLFIRGADADSGGSYNVGSGGGTDDPTTLTTTVPSATTSSPGDAGTPVTVAASAHTHDLDVSLDDKYDLTPFYTLAFIMYTG